MAVYSTTFSLGDKVRFVNLPPNADDIPWYVATVKLTETDRGFFDITYGIATDPNPYAPRDYQDGMHQETLDFWTNMLPATERTSP
jgi:hypothetical protein